LVLFCCLLLDASGPGGWGVEVVKGGKGAESLHEGERSRALGLWLTTEVENLCPTR